MSKPLRVLIAEDDPGIRDGLADLLESEGYTSLGAEDGQEAVEILQRGEKFDILVSDFRMPRMDGVALLKWCRANGFHFPVLFITANRELFPLEEEALKDCCAELLHKPLQIDDFLQSLTAAAARSHVRDCGGHPAPKEP